METNLASPAAESAPVGDALRTLCFADDVFSQRYEGWHVLGRGSLATVIKTWSRDLGHDIALKIFVNLDPDSLHRVREEVHAVQVVASPCLVQIYSLFDRGPIAWFEMELVEGPNLQQELDRLARAGERLPMVRAYEIALSLSRCLWSAHRQGVLHRDIKPANVLLPASGRPAAKVTDFGIARVADAASNTPSGAVRGTPRFASPEALAGEDAGAPHDVYGLAATLYALFSGGHLAYDISGGETLAALRRLQVATRPTPLCSLAPELDQRVEDVLRRGLDGEPARRPSPGKVVRVLEGAQVRLIAASHTSGTTEVTVGRWRVVIAGLGLAALSLWTQGRRRRDRSATPIR